MNRTLFATHLKIRNTLFILIAIVTALFVVLKSGISIDHLMISSFTIDRLYLKLDKKLILRVQSVVIPVTKKKHSLPNLEEDLDKIKNILNYFQMIELKDVHFENDNYGLLYADNIFYMTNDLFEVAAHEISRVGDELQAVIDLVYLKQYDMRLSGKMVYNYKKDIALVQGNAQFQDINIDFLINKRKENLLYSMQSNEFSQLKPLISQFGLPESVAPWITERVKAKSYKLNSLKGMGKISRDGMELLPKTIVAEAFLQDATVQFNNKLDAVVEAERIRVVFAEGNLQFDFENPYYQKRSLAGSSVSIINFTKPEPIVLKLDLKLDTRLDLEVIRVLKAYNITLPLLQKSGTTDARLQIDVRLKTVKVDFIGDFNLTKGEVIIGNIVLPVVKGKVHVEDGVATLSGFKVHDTMYQSGIEGKVDLREKIADLKLDIDSLRLGTKENSFLSMTQTKLPMKIDYKNGLLITLPSLKIRIKVSPKDQSAVVDIADLTLLKTSLKNFPVSINGGNLTLATKDYKTYQYDGLIKRNDCFIYENETQCMVQVPISGTFSEKSFTLKAFQDRLVVDTSKSLATLTNLNLDLKKFFDNLDNDPKSGITKKIKVTGINSVLRYEKSKLVTDRYDLEISPGKSFHFKGSLGQDIVTVTKSGENLEIKAIRISDKMLHPLINFDGLQKGSYSVEISGVQGKAMKGIITLDGGVMSSFKAYNNALAFINTVPALATLNSPGFSSRGFKIKYGEIRFTITGGEILTFDSVLIKGDSATISGKGTINLKTQKIDVDLAIQTAKAVGKLIGSLPLVGYILTGENKSIMTVGLHIGGTLENPTTQISPIKDVLLIPFKMIERTFTGPKKR